MDQQQDVVDDETLVVAVRAGDTRAYGELYRRHAASAHSYARRFVYSDADAADVVAEAFTRLLAALGRGAGPADGFLPYLLRTIRNLSCDRREAARRVEPTDETSVLESVVPFHDPVVERCERHLLGRAFRGLPERWRDVLWLLSVEGRSVDEVADSLGIKPNAVTSLTYRAREGLRQAYLTENVLAGSGTACRARGARLAAFVRGTLGPVATQRVERHLDGCGPCRADVRELAELNATLRDPSLSARVDDRVPPTALRVRQRSAPDGLRRSWAPGRVA